MRSALFSLLLLAAPAQAEPVRLTFLPPEVAPQTLCRAGLSDGEDDLTASPTDLAQLTDALRLAYVNRDIRRLQDEDPDRWFAFITDLIDWKARLDAGFDAFDVMLAKTDLMIDAGRLDDLTASGFVAKLTAARTRLNGAQKMRLAQLHLNGIGTAPDLALAQALMVEAAYGGNAEALLAIARMTAERGPVPGWDVPMDLTVTLAFTGLVGQLDDGVCRRAERIARLYLDGTVVARNPQAAYAWTKFAADLGSAQAAWRMVEFHLSAEAVARDDAVLLYYLQLAVDRGIALKGNQIEALEADPGLELAAIRRILGPNRSRDDGSALNRLEPFLTLAVNLSDEEVSRDSPMLQYLQEVTRLPSAPGFVFTALAEEVIARDGRWAGEARAAGYLEQAAAKGDPAGMRRLAEIQLRYRWDAARVNRAQNLLAEAATRWGDAQAMEDLDGLLRCQVPDAPRMAEARLWADSYAATGARAVEVAPGDLPGLDPFMDPETLAQIQAQALDGRFESLARMAVRLQRDRFVTDDAMRFWAGRVSASENALEDFALMEYALAAGPRDRDIAVELMRRAYLNNGPTTALELGIVLTEYAGRDPAIDAEITDLLTRAGNRGEGAAIRLMARHLAPGTPPSQVYARFATVIEERGDFLALMFAIPFVPTAQAQDYLDRAVALMACGSKDVEELADAQAFLGAADQALQWKRVGLAMDYGQSLSQLAISDRQMDFYGRGAAPGQVAVLERELAEGDLSARRALFALTADPDLAPYDPARAAGYLVGALDGASAADEAWILQAYRAAPQAVRDAADARFDLRGLYARVAGRGDAVAMRELGLLLRDAPPADPAMAARWLTQAAEAGDVIAMREAGFMLALGLAGPPDRAAALVWLRQAATAGDAEAARLAALLGGPP